MVGTHTDITERKEIENQILRERQKMMTILGAMNDGVSIISHNYQVEYINASMSEEFGSPEGMQCYEYFSNRQKPCPWCKNEEVFSGKSVQYEWYCEPKDKYYDLFAAPIVNSDGTLSKLEIYHDITKLKQAESAIRASLAEKDTLLKEIHHRVKNNLQIISSLLNLQERFVRDPADIDIFRNSRSRVKSMALIHEVLYQSKNISQIDFSEYVDKLVSHLVQGHLNNYAGITVRTDVAGIKLDIDTAIPCGLIINELLTNAFKYAFPAGSTGEIGIRMSRSGDICLLCVYDNGVGFPDTIDFTSDKTLGMNLVYNLARQLGGEIRVGKELGVSICIEFPYIKK
jgi:two-component sensor histidine kinase